MGEAVHIGKFGRVVVWADAVLSVDIGYETVGSNMLMVSASGTPVRLS